VLVYGVYKPDLIQLGFPDAGLKVELRELLGDEFWLWIVAYESEEFDCIRNKWRTPCSSEGILDGAVAGILLHKVCHDVARKKQEEEDMCIPLVLKL
jgi:hypothetical protein